MAGNSLGASRFLHRSKTSKLDVLQENKIVKRLEEAQNYFQLVFLWPAIMEEKLDDDTC